MNYNPQRHHRRSIRLQGYDYTQPGAYFVTLVTHGRACLFGEIVGGEMRLNALGEIARAEWFQTAVLRPYVMLYDDEFVVMPNHVHGIIWIVGDDRRRGAAALRPYDDDPRPYGDDPRPYDDDPRPYGDDPRPHGDDPRPYGDDLRPHGDDPRPYGDDPRPYGDDPRPYGDDPRPYGDDPRPYGDDPRPYDNDPRPYDNDPRPYGDDPRPYDDDAPRPHDAPPPTNVIPGSLGAIVRAYKSAVTKRIHALNGTPDVPVWQRNYYEHIIRNEEELTRIRRYILNNPVLWTEDRENPNKVTFAQRRT